MAIVSCNRVLAAYAEAVPDRPAITCGEQSITRGRSARRGRTARPRPCRQRRATRRHGDDRRCRTRSTGSSPTWRAGRSGPSRSRCRRSSPAASSRPSSSWPTRRSSSALRTKRSPSCRLDRPPAARAPAADPAQRRAAARRRVSPAWKAPTSGGSTGRPKLIVSGDPALFDTEAPAPLGGPRRRLPAVPGPALPQRSGGLVVPGTAPGQPRGGAPALRRRGDAGGDRAVRRRRHLPRADDDEAHPAPRRRRARTATTCRRCGSCGTSPSRARRG